MPTSSSSCICPHDWWLDFDALTFEGRRVVFPIRALGPVEPLAEGVMEVAARVLYARDRKWAFIVEDVRGRRTTLALTGRDSGALRARVEALLAS